ncbi:MAG: Ppx/GppA phosphatase family protein [Pseudomonadales bacterium]
MRRQLAALDLGSNSFHLLVVSEQDDHIQVVDKYREMVRLAAGLRNDGYLDEETEFRALNCLERLGERLRGLARDNVRIVGTSALRQAKNSAAFIQRAERILGHDIEIIGGREEARLIYLGVSHSLEDSADRRLVVDIGGGSTELILGRHFDPEEMESLHMGCVAMSGAYFPDGRIGRKAFELAINRARQELEPVMHQFRRPNWETAIGASGTILAIESILSADGGETGVITRAGLERLVGQLSDARHLSEVPLPQLSAERHPVFCGGLAILAAVFAELDVEFMHASSGALREGLIYDLLGRVHHTDIREATVVNVRRRYHVDIAHANRVQSLVMSLHDQLAEQQGPADADADADAKSILRWAADLHEIGMDISHSQYHKHGGYLLLNMDMPGFSRRDQARLATLVRAHRRKFPMPLFVGPDGNQLILPAVLLRLAVLLCRSREPQSLPPMQLLPGSGDLTLQIPAAWLNAHPLTRLDLVQEAAFLSAIPFTLVVEET